MANKSEKVWPTKDKMCGQQMRNGSPNTNSFKLLGVKSVSSNIFCQQMRKALPNTNNFELLGELFCWVQQSWPNKRGKGVLPRYKANSPDIATVCSIMNVN